MNLSRNERREARERKHGVESPRLVKMLGADARLAENDEDPEPQPLRLFRVTPVCGGRAVGESLEVMGTDAMSVARAHVGWAGLVAYGAHPQVLPVEEPAAPVSDIFSADPMDAREREDLRRAIQGETQADLMAGRGAAA